MGGCRDVILPPEYLECFANRGLLEPQVLLVHHVPGSSGDNRSIGQMKKKSTMSSTEWLMGSLEYMVGLPQINGTRTDGSRTDR